MRHVVAVALGSVVAQAPAPGVLVAQHAELSTHVAGLPAPGAPPSRQLAGAVIDVEVGGQGATYFPKATVTLAGAPGGYDGEVRFGMGHRSGPSCELQPMGSAPLGSVTTAYQVTGGYNPDYFPTPPRPFDCAVAELREGATVLDALVGEVTSTFHRPQLAVRAVRQLGGKPNQLKLVQGVATEIDVTLRNAGQVAARDVVVSGKGSGLKVRGATVAEIAPGGTGTATLKVTARSRKLGKLTVTAAGGGASSTRTLRPRRVGPPPRPPAGKYQNPSRSVTFFVRRGRVTGWRGAMQTVCGGHGTIPTYTRNTYDFRTVAIPRNGIVQASQRGAEYGAHLQMKLTGARVTHGRFDYAGPGDCRAVTTFTARRVGA
ncbi:MAG TPA: hypothetical protein VNS09_26740 [Solirubrobacter sp.]|nr:hypothetical protein [Solirubrobacter sp.]